MYEIYTYQCLSLLQVYYFNVWLGRGLVFNDEIADKAQGIRQNFGEAQVWAKPLKMVVNVGKAEDKAEQCRILVKKFSSYNLSPYFFPSFTSYMYPSQAVSAFCTSPFRSQQRPKWQQVSRSQKPRFVLCGKRIAMHTTQSSMLFIAQFYFNSGCRSTIEAQTWCRQVRSLVRMQRKNSMLGSVWKIVG